MGYLRRQFSYSKLEKEDAEERKRRRAQFLIYKVLERADSRRRSSTMRIRICKLKIKIGKNLRRLRKSVQITISIAKDGVYKQVVGQFKLLKRVLSGRDAAVALPPMFT